MTVCKFFMQGYCKFGDQCRFEHTRNSSYNDDQYSGRHNRHHNKGYNDSKQSSRQDYIKPSQFQGNQRNNQENYSSPFSRGNQAQQIQHQKSPFENQSDRFHWKKQANRFEVLGEVDGGNSLKGASSEDDVILTSIEKDIKEWTNSTMWPYSCYYVDKHKKCVEGLPDILAEELRILYHLHGEEAYKKIMYEVNSMYTRRKEELMQMSQETRMSVLTELHTSSESNPSSCLTIMSMYGPGVDFSPTPSVTASSLFPQNQASLEQDPVISPQPATHSKQPPVATDTNKPITEAPKPSLFKTDIAASLQKPISVKSDSAFTDKSLLTDDEIEQFQANSFTLGKIPMRPPPAEYCK